MKVKSRCIDCGAVFEKPLCMSVAGGKHYAFCPECKKDNLRLIIPEMPGMNATYKIKVEVEQVKGDE